LIEENRELATKASPIRSILINEKRFLIARTEPEMHLPRSTAGQFLQSVGVKTELQDVSRLALGTAEFGVDWFVVTETISRFVNANQKVSDTADSLVDEGHLVHHVGAPIEWITNSRHPLRERLVRIASRNLVDRAPLVFEIGEAVAFVRRSFLDE
jgi:hypothetical protein